MKKKFKIKGAKKALRNVEDISTKENVQIDMDSYESKRATEASQKQAYRIKKYYFKFYERNTRNFR